MSNHRELKLELGMIDKSQGTGDINPQQSLVLFADPNDIAFIAALQAEIHRHYPPARVICCDIPAAPGRSASARTKHWRTIVAQVQEAFGLPPLRPGQELFRAQSALEHNMWDRGDFLVLDHAEHLEGAWLRFFRRDSRGRLPTLLVVRDQAAFESTLANFSDVARRLWELDWTPMQPEQD